MSSLIIIAAIGLILLALFFVYSYSRLKAWLALTPASPMPYRQFFNISMFAFVACCIAMGVGIAQANYMMQPLAVYMEVFIPPLCIITGFMAFSYVNGYAAKPARAITKSLFTFLGLLALSEVLFGIFCFLLALAIAFFGFGRMLND